jgi:PAS domain S-box-containing protein
MDGDRHWGSADAQLAAIVDSSFDAIVSKDLNSIIQSWNPAAERLFGYTQAEAVGRSVTMLIPDDRRNEEDRIISRIRRGERVETFESLRRSKDGTLIPVSLTISPIKSGNGEIVGASKIARDISATKQNERRIRLLMREVNHRVKNQYAVILSIIDETSKRVADPKTFSARIRERVIALARSHDLLVASDWSGADMKDLVREHLQPFGHEERISTAGAAITLDANQVQYLGMALHELATNSAKYGALAESYGQISIEWALIEENGPRFMLTWKETCPTKVTDHPHSKSSGFGTVVLKRVTPHALDGEAILERQPGLVMWKLIAPVASSTDEMGSD